MISRRALFPAICVAVTGCAAEPAYAVDPLAAAVAELERGFIVKDGLPMWLCQTGEAYLAITSSGHKPEFVSNLGWYEARAEAVAAWFMVVKGYAFGKRGTLYWRVRPEVDRRLVDDKESDGWSVYSRLLISDKPEIYSTVDDVPGVRPSHQVSWPPQVYA